MIANTASGALQKRDLQTRVRPSRAKEERPRQRVRDADTGSPSVTQRVFNHVNPGAVGQGLHCAFSS